MGQKKKTQYLAVATGVLVVTAVLRLVALQDVPPGLARDETLNADIASFILDGRHALFFREGYGHEALYHYIGAAFQALIGDNFLAIRLPSVFLGLLMVAVSMALAKRVGKRMGGANGGYLAATLTGLFLAVSWWPIILSRVGLRPILFPLILVLALLNWERRPYLAGFLLGLTTYSYTAARAVLVLPFVMLVYLLLFRKRLEIGRSQLRDVLVIGLIALLVYLPLGLTLRADPTLQERVNQLSGPLDAAREGDFGPLFETTTATLGVFTFTGDPLSSYALPDVPLFGPLMGLLFYGGLLLCLLRIGRHPQYGLLLIWLGVTLLPSAAAADAPSLIRLVGAMPVIYMLPALAGQWVYQWGVDSGRWTVGNRHWVVAGLIVFVLVGVNLRATVVEGFGEWTSLAETRQKYQSIWLDIGRYWADNGLDSGAGLVVADSWYEPVKADSLRRDVGQPLDARWVQQGRAIVFPVDQSAYLFVPEFAAPLPLLWEMADLGQPLYRSEAYPSFAVYQLPDSVAMLEHVVEEPFLAPGTSETGLTLLGWQTEWRAETAELYLLSHWRVAAPSAGTLPWDTTIFAHLWDETGQAVAQHDTFDVAPLRLHPGDEFWQMQVIPVLEGLGPYQLVLGLYNRDAAVRWQRTVGEPSDAIVLVPAWTPEGDS